MNGLIDSEGVEGFLNKYPQMVSRMDFLVRQYCKRDSNIRKRAIEVLEEKERMIRRQDKFIKKNLDDAEPGGEEELMLKGFEQLIQNVAVYGEYREVLEQDIAMEDFVYDEDFRPVVVTLFSAKKTKGFTDIAKKLKERLVKYLDHGIQSFIDAQEKPVAQRASDIFNVRQFMSERSSKDLAKGIIDQEDDLYAGPCLLVLCGRLCQAAGKIVALITLPDSYKDNIIKHMNATVLENDRGPDCMETFNNEWSIANNGTTRDESLVIYRGHFSDVTYDPRFHPTNLLIPVVALGLSAIDPVCCKTADAWNSRRFKSEQVKHGAEREKKRTDKRKEFERCVSCQPGGEYKLAVSSYDIVDQSIITEYLAFSHLPESDAKDLFRELEELEKICACEQQLASLDLTTKYTPSIFSGVMYFIRDFYYLCRYRTLQGLACRLNMHFSSIIFLGGVQVLIPQYGIPLSILVEILHDVGYVQSDQQKLQRECNQWVQEEFNAGDESNRTILDVFYDVYRNSSSSEKNKYVHTDHTVTGPLAVKESLKTTGTDVILFCLTAGGDQIYQGIQLTGEGLRKLARKLKKSCVEGDWHMPPILFLRSN